MTMQPFTVYNGDDAFPVRVLPTEAFDICPARRVLWNRHGEVRAIPRAVLIDAYKQEQAWQNRPRRWTEARPPGLGVVRWEQTFMTLRPLTKH